jgi:hypothetical protein
MKSLHHYQLSHGTTLEYTSVICGLAASIDWPNVTPQASYCNELTQAYLNQWGFLLSAYSNLYNIHEVLSQADATESNNFTKFDLLSTDKETAVRDYAYMLIISMKTIFDLYTCLVDFILTKDIPKEHNMKDMSQIRKKIKKQPELIPLEFLTDTNSIADKIADMRNCLVHRGYIVAANFRFEPTSDIPLQIFKGTDRFNGTKMGAGELFETFLQCIITFEQEAVRVLPTIVIDLQGAPFIEVQYSYDGGATNYSFKEK